MIKITLTVVQDGNEKTVTTEFNMPETFDALIDDLKNTGLSSGSKDILRLEVGQRVYNALVVKDEGNPNPKLANLIMDFIKVV